MTYTPKSEKQLKNWYKAKAKDGKNGFASEADFINWYSEQNKICNYCKLTEEESQALVMRGLLTSNRFPQNGRIGQGTSRGVWLEVDRRNPKDSYSRNNCVLACCFCNNDKSDVFHDHEYEEFIKDRIGFLRRRLQTIK